MKRTIGYIAISTFLFSSMEIALKIAGPVFSALQMNFLRFLIGGIVLLPMALKFLRSNKITARAHWPLFALTGFICVVVSMTFYQIAVENAPAAPVAVLFSCNPVFALIFSYIILHESLSRSSIISVIVSVIGLLVIINPAHLSNPFGLFMALMSAVLFGLYSIVSRYGSQKYGYNGITMTTFTFFAGALELLAVIGLSHLPIIENWLGSGVFVDISVFHGITWSTLPLLLFIGIGITGGGFALYFMAMERSDVSTASLVFFIKPGLAPILAAIILGENIPVTTIIGIIIILIGSVITFMGENFMERVDAMNPWHHDQ